MEAKENPGPKERAFLGRYTLRQERFEHGDLELDVLLPSRADELIDEREFGADERLPYWAELWPAARALAGILLDEPVPAGRVIELGCGLGLPSLALRARGADVLATDYYPEALEFTRINARRNRIPEPPTLLLDWRVPPPELGRFDLVIAADVLYERRNADALADLLPRLTAPGGLVRVADPGRAYREELEASIRRLGWAVSSRPLPDVPRGALLELRPPAKGA